jgi:hypothetical protein
MKSRLADPFGKLADGAHDPVLQLFQKQNRELPYASCVGASRVKYRLKKRLSKWQNTIRYFIISLRSGGKFAADITLTAFVKKP